MILSLILFQVLIILILIIVGDAVCIARINNVIGWDVEQRSISVLSSIFFDLRRKDLTVTRNDFEASFRTKVLLGSFVEGNEFLQIGSLKVDVKVCQKRSHF
jgi:hypothetical protein